MKENKFFEAYDKGELDRSAFLYRALAALLLDRQAWSESEYDVHTMHVADTTIVLSVFPDFHENFVCYGGDRAAGEVLVKVEVTESSESSLYYVSMSTYHRTLSFSKSELRGDSGPLTAEEKLTPLLVQGLARYIDAAIEREREFHIRRESERRPE